MNANMWVDSSAAVDVDSDEQHLDGKKYRPVIISSGGDSIMLLMESPEATRLLIEKLQSIL